jgi:hypothetical protein
MPIGRIDGFCAVVTLTPREICVQYPVSQQLCVSLPDIGIADPSELLMQFFAQLNSALQPLTPILNIIDAVLAIFECVKAIPKAITQLDPTDLIECLPGLAEAIQKLLKMLPPLSIPILIVQILDTMIYYMQTVRNQIAGIIARAQAIAEAATRAVEPGNFQLGLALDCINANFGIDLQNLNEQFLPLNRLIGIVNALLEIIGLEPLPSVTEIPDPASAAALAFMDVQIDFLTAVRSTIPVPLDP